MQVPGERHHFAIYLLAREFFFVWQFHIYVLTSLTSPRIEVSEQRPQPTSEWPRAVPGAHSLQRPQLGCWLAMLTTWVIPLALWIKQLGVYNKANREYEQARREYEKAYGQPSEELRLVQERLRNIQKNPGVTLKLLHRLGLILGQTDIKSDPREVKILTVGIHGGDKVRKFLNLPGRGAKEKLLHSGRLLLMAGGECGRFFRCHSDISVKPNK